MENYFRKMFIAAEIVNNHIIPITDTKYYSEGEAINHISQLVIANTKRAFTILPLCEFTYDNLKEFKERQERITNKYLNVTTVTL